MGKRLANAKEKWIRLKKSAGFHNILLFVLFVVIASLFWIIMAMNDSAQVTLDVNMRIIGKPDSLTFINAPPQPIPVTVSDKGTSLLRAALARHPVIQFNFKEYAENGVFRLKASDIYAQIRARFGTQAQISNISVDSVSLAYTALPPKTVPIEIVSHLSATPGYVVDKHLTPSKKFVLVYSTNNTLLDTLMRVRTKPITGANLAHTTNYKIGFEPIKGARIVPSSITVSVNVEPLVTKEVKVEVKAINVPEGENISLFPSMVSVSAFVPMSRFNEPLTDLEVAVNYSDIDQANGYKRLPVKILDAPRYAIDPKPNPASVEYILVK